MRAVTDSMDNMEASNLTGFTDQVSSQLEELVEHIPELEKDRISDCLRIDGLGSRLNAGADELDVGETIVRSPEELKEHLVSFQGEASDFGGLVCVYNILTRIHQLIKGEKTMEEVMKNKKDLARLKILEDEAITVYIFSIMVSRIFGGRQQPSQTSITFLHMESGETRVFRQVWVMNRRICWIQCTGT